LILTDLSDQTRHAPASLALHQARWLGTLLSRAGTAVLAETSARTPASPRRGHPPCPRLVGFDAGRAGGCPPRNFDTDRAGALAVRKTSSSSSSSSSSVIRSVPAPSHQELMQGVRGDWHLPSPAPAKHMQGVRGGERLSPYQRKRSRWKECGVASICQYQRERPNLIDRGAIVASASRALERQARRHVTESSERLLCRGGGSLGIRI
jgi:hypothetical protein